MQELQSGNHRLRIGDRVLVRRQRWRITALDPYEQCQLITLAGIDTGNAGKERRVVTPFEQITRTGATSRLRLVSRRRWRNACRAAIVSSGSAESVWSAASARIEVLPHQFEPALAITSGQATRVLIADAVGLGKTIQAALIAAELLRRGAATRVLVLVPAGLREQWLEELSVRFGLDFAIADAAKIRRKRRELPAGVNPWIAVPLAICSQDYAKRRDILAGLHGCGWDVVVVDEAHGAVSDSERHRAIARLTGSAPYVVLLTATPHNGDERAFRSLLDLGQRGDAPLVFRRDRGAAAITIARRVHQLHVRPTPAEEQMHARLQRFIAAVEREHGAHRATLALSVLRKRALSSAFAIAASVRRRLLHLSPSAAGWQLPLPLPVDDAQNDDEAPIWTVPDLANRGEERRLLRDVAQAAEIAARQESKLRVLARLIRRIGQPAIVFTEYRDTLVHVRDSVLPDAVVLHGGLSRRERTAALELFRSGRILLATDAAGEGLNLQQHCRCVINLELPWSPTRLEQRIGRVDRIGQRQRVHVFHLIARATDEAKILARLSERVARARSAIGATDPLTSVPPGAPDDTLPDTPLARLEEAAHAEQIRLRRARRLGAGPEPSNSAFISTPSTPLRRILRGRSLLVACTALCSAQGRQLALFIAGSIPAPNTKSGLAMLMRVGGQLAGERRAAWLEQARSVHKAFWETRIERELALTPDAEDQSSAQPGLFDRRVERAHEQLLSARAERAARRDQRIAQLRELARLEEASVACVLLLVP